MRMGLGYGLSLSEAIPLIGIDLSPKRIAVFGDSITRACSKNNLDPERYVSGVTKANPGIAAKTGHLMAANPAFHWGYLGMTQLNEQVTNITVPDANTFSVGVDTTGYGTWTGNGYTIQEKGAVITHLAQGYTSGLNMLSHQRYLFDPRHNRGYSGDTAATMNARKEVSLGNINADIIVVLTGTNDIGTTTAITPRTNTAIMADVQAILSYITDTLGKVAVLGDVPPNGNNTTAQQDQRVALNALYDTLESSKVRRWRFYDDVVDPATRGWLNSHDNTHPGPYAGFVLSKRLNDLLLPFYGAGAYVLNAGNMLLNPGLSGSSGSLSGTLATNSGIANSWTLTGVGTGAQSTRIGSKAADGAQQFDVNWGALSSGERIHLSQTVSSGLVVGTKYVAEAEISIESYTGAGGKWYEVTLELRNTSAVQSTDNARRNTDALNIPAMISYCAAGKRLHLKTLPIEYLTGWTGLQVRINLGGDCAAGGFAGRMKIYNAQLYPV